MRACVARALQQIEEKKYESELVADGIAKERIRKYGFAFDGKKCSDRLIEGEYFEAYHYLFHRCI